MVIYGGEHFLCGGQDGTGRRGKKSDGGITIPSRPVTVVRTPLPSSLFATLLNLLHCSPTVPQGWHRFRMLRRRVQCRKYKDVQLDISEHRTLTPPPLVTRMEYNNTELWPGTRTGISWGPTLPRLPRYRWTGSIVSLSPHICHGIHASTTQQCFSLVTYLLSITRRGRPGIWIAYT